MRAAGGVSGGVGNRRAESIRIDPRGGRANGVCRIWSRWLGGIVRGAHTYSKRKDRRNTQRPSSAVADLPIECKEIALQATCLRRQTTW